MVYTCLPQAGEKDLVSKLKATIRRLQQCSTSSSSSTHDTTFKLPSAAASVEERSPLKELAEPRGGKQPLPFHTASEFVFVICLSVFIRRDTCLLVRTVKSAS